MRKEKQEIELLKVELTAWQDMARELWCDLECGGETDGLTQDFCVDSCHRHVHARVRLIKHLEKLQEVYNDLPNK